MTGSSRDKEGNTVRKQTLSSQIERQIQQNFQERKYQIGDRLPSDRELASTLKVSRPMVREALRALEAKGFVEVRLGVHGGRFLTAITPDTMRETVRYQIATGQVSHKDVMEMRLLIEPAITGMAARRYTEENAGRLLGALQELERGFRKSDLFIHEQERNLHSVIADMSGNPLGSVIMGMLVGVGIEKHRDIPMTLEMQESILREHKAIVDAIMARDEERAMQASREHIMSIFDIHSSGGMDK